jgi:hypothetical protein
MMPAEVFPMMEHDKTRRGPQDASRINVDADYEVYYWTKKFAVTPEQLRAAVQLVGTSAEAVGRELKKQ